MYRLVSLLAATALTFSVAQTALAAGLDARLSATRVASGDQVILSLSADASDGTGQPDLSALEHDFTVLGTSSGTQTTIINGARSDSVTWQITLVPKHEGTITVPAITAGRVSSEPLTLAVVAASDLPLAARVGRPAITAALPAGSVYAHQEVPVTVSVRLPAGTQGADIRAPEAANALIEQSGDDRIARQPDGSALLERTYLVRPQAEGEITLDGFTVTAEVSDPNAPDPFASFGRSPFRNGPFADFFNQPFGGAPFGSMFAPTRRFSATSAPLTMIVQATPGGETGWALPAKSVELHEIWQPDPPALKVGEAVTRKIQVVALGAHAEQIPDLVLPDLQGASVYAEGSDKRSVPTAKGTAAIREFTWSVVPTTGGDLVLPEVTLDWFDTGAETPQVAVLPARTFHVEGPVTAPPAPAKASTSSATATVSKSSERWLTTALIGGAMLVLALAGMSLRLLVRSFRHSPHRPRPPQPAARSSAANRTAALTRAITASRSGDRAGLHRAALDWVRAGGTPLDRAALFYPHLMSAVTALETELYGKGPAAANAADVLAELKAAHRTIATPKRGRPALPPLYPATS